MARNLKQEEYLQQRFVLNPDLALRPDGTRAVLYARLPEESGIGTFHHFLSPRAALFLSLHNGDMSFGAVLEIWKHLTNQEIEFVRDEALLILQSLRVLEVEPLIPVDDVPLSSIPRYNPNDFLIAGVPDLKTTRCARPTDMVHEICYKCATSCRYCYSDLGNHRNRLLPLDRIGEIVEEIRHMGVYSAGISGGDPFCHPEILEILRLYHKAGIQTEVPTKCFLSENQLACIRELSSVSLQFSLDCLDEAINDWLIGREGGTARILESLRKTTKMGLSFAINSVITPYNYNKMDDLLRYLLSEYGSNVRRISLTPYGKSLYRHDDKFCLEPAADSEVRETVNSVLVDFPQANINFADEGTPPSTFYEKSKDYEGRSQCSGNRSSFVLLPDGKVTVCEELYYHPEFIIGDASDQSIAEIWDGERALRLAFPSQDNVKSGECKFCFDFERCNTVKGRCYKFVLKAYGLDKPDWPDPRCPYAPLGQRFY
ncbi:hypothetical protein D3OALGA1CA_5089 [Olavius algarvensis associated proteobacterium Delta 3]|nr:hypothetical protein D3OALGA1CA_5089 [Olavius algarvensis associated proteobacterium Delta 3]